MTLDELKLSEKRKNICERLGLNCVNDIISYYPARYERYDLQSYENFEIGSQVVLYGQLISYPTSFRRGKFTTSRFKVLYQEEELIITIFNRPWIKNLKMNEMLTIIGKYEGNNKITATSYYAKDISGQIIPIYSVKEGISQNDIKKLIDYTFDKICDFDDDLPSELIYKHQLISYQQAIRNIHKPINYEMLTKAISRLKYEEFLKFYLALNILKQENTESLKKHKVFSDEKIEEFITNFPYELTKDQIIVKNEILHDLKSNKIMYRLLQGEVGSGKTAIAAIALYANYLAGFQGAIMAPTEILAKQHYESLRKQLEPFDVKVDVLYSALDKQNEVKERIKNGETDIIVGTHALFSEDVEYHNLGLVIADEQHRFGVKQRQALKNKGENCDFLLMSATPIPRTLASSLYGDMDVSTIATLPSNRKGCKTYLITENSIASILEEVKNTLKQGRQIYVVAASIEKNDNYKAKDVNGLFIALSDALKPYKISLLHGKMSSEQKDDIMKKFNDNEIQVLVSTTVVEVGVNVTNATMMIVYDADRFGLSQLHQLRGRVQRSVYEGTCFLLTDNKDSEVKRRLQILCNSNDGFEISYEDLKIRGPGDILGTRQSGLPAFILGNLIEDTRFIDAAKKDVQLIIDNLDKKEYRNYYSQVEKMAVKNYIT